MNTLSCEDKWKLFLNLYKHGCCLDIIQKALPEYRSDQIIHAIRYYRNKASRIRDNIHDRRNDFANLSNLNVWKKHLYNCHSVEGTHVARNAKNKHNPVDVEDKGNYCELLSKLMLYAACFENHYQSDDLDKPNYSEIYRYLSQILAGEEPTQLRPGSANKVLEMIARLTTMVDNIQHCKLKSAFTSSNPLKDKTTTSTINSEEEQDVIPLFEDLQETFSPVLRPDDPYYEFKKKEAIDKVNEENLKTAHKLIKVPGFNPLNFDAELMVLPHKVSEVEKKSSIAEFWARYRRMDQSFSDNGYSLVEPDNNIDCTIDEEYKDKDNDKLYFKIDNSDE